MRGALVAHYDISRGHYQILGYGLPAPTRREYVRILKTRYGVEYHAVAGCIVSQQLVDYVDAYDEVSMSAAQRKFGLDIFKKASTEAETSWSNAHQQAELH